MNSHHPLVGSFISSPDQFDDLVEQCAKTGDRLGQCLLSLRDDRPPPGQAIAWFGRLADELQQSDLDSEARLLALWAAVPDLPPDDIFALAEPVFTTMENLVDEHTHPQIAAIPAYWSILATGWVIRFNRGTSDRDLRQGGFFITHHDVNHLAWRGLALPLINRHEEVEISYGQAADTFWERARFINAMETCRLSESAWLLERSDEIGPNGFGMASRRIQFARLMAWFVNLSIGNRNFSRSQAEQVIASKASRAELGEYFEILYTLLRCLFGDDRELEQEKVRSEGSWLTLSNICGYSGIRPALILGDTDYARDKLTKRRSVGMSHYMDNFFWARIYLQEGDPQRAAQCFRQMLSRSYEYGAENRVRFELRLARELGPMDLFELGRMTEELDDELSSPHVIVDMGRSGGTDGEEERIASQLIGISQPIDRVRELILAYAESDAAVLITGETGTGKELVARAIHENSGRQGQPFIALNCGGMADSLLEAELFGHRKGAFTGADRQHRGLIAMTGSGTLFLDEIGEASLRFQSALLRLLESGEYRQVGDTQSQQMHCRIIAATNVSPEDWHRHQEHRRDLFYRLSRLHILLPPLRNRRSDIPHLAHYFLSRHNAEASLDPTLIGELRDLDWPGNVRQLRNAIEALVLQFPNCLRYSLREWQSADAEGSLTGLMEKMDASPLREQTDRQTGRVSEALKANSVDGDIPIAGQESFDVAEDRADAAEPDLALHRYTGNRRMRRLQALRDLCERRGRITRKEACLLLDISPVTAAKYLQELQHEGSLIREEPTPAPATHFFRWSGET